MMKYKCEQCQRRTCTVTGPVSDFAPDGCLRFSSTDSEWRKVEPAEPDGPEPYVTTWPDVLPNGSTCFVHVECPGCKEWEKTAGEISDRSARQAGEIEDLKVELFDLAKKCPGCEEKDSEIRHLRGMLRQAAEECTGCESLREELAHCESVLIDSQDKDIGQLETILASIDAIHATLDKWEPK